MKDLMNNPAVINQLIVFGILIVAMWFLIMRPQRKKEKEIANMRNSIQVGDEILTIGGIYGKVMKVKEESLIIQVGVDKVKFEITRWAVSKVLSSADTKNKKSFKEEKEETKKKSLPKKLLKDKPETSSEESADVVSNEANESENAEPKEEKAE